MVELVNVGFEPHSLSHSADAPYTKSENETRPDDAHSSELASLNTAKAKTKFELELQPVIQQNKNKASRETQNRIRPFRFRKSACRISKSRSKLAIRFL